MPHRGWNGHLVGPSWMGLSGRDEEIEGGTTVEVDEAYIEESIKDPGARTTNGFTNLMPAFDSLP